MSAWNPSTDLAGKAAGGRKLIAVVYADMVAYSRLMGLDDAGTLARLKTLRASLIDPAIAEHGGRIVQTGGDSLLMVFDSIDGAVRCAVKVQQQIPILDDHQPADRTIRFRVGIDIGDAIADGTDFHGDGVIVAARLQAECPPGGICVSRAVRDHVHDQLGLIFEALGPLALKNIARPVEAFVLQADFAPTPRPAARSLAHSIGEALPLPDKPSIAVLSFTNMSGDPEQEYFSDGVADDIITELSRYRALLVIARNSSFAYRGRTVDVKQVSSDLGARYIVDGSVRSNGDRVRVNAQLIDAETGNHLWAERYDRLRADVFAVQDEITIAVTRAIGPAIASAEQRRALRKTPESLGAWEAYQRGLWHMGKCNPVDSSRAQQFFDQAIGADRTFAAAHSASAMAIILDGAYGVREWVEGHRIAADRAQHAIELDPSDVEAHAIVALKRFAVDGDEQGLATLSAMLLHCPNAAWAHGVIGILHVQLGRYAEGRTSLLAAERLNPRDPSAAIFPTHLAISYYYERDYARAVAAARHVLDRYPDYPIAHRFLAASLGQLGQSHEARIALQKALQVSREAFMRLVHARPPWVRQEDFDHLLEGLRKAGWQDD